MKIYDPLTDEIYVSSAETEEEIEDLKKRGFVLIKEDN